MREYWTAPRHSTHPSSFEAPRSSKVMPTGFVHARKKTLPATLCHKRAYVHVREMVIVWWHLLPFVVSCDGMPVLLALRWHREEMNAERSRLKICLIDSPPGFKPFLFQLGDEAFERTDFRDIYDTGAHNGPLLFPPLSFSL
jgi:hypothetical protein